MKQKTIDFIRSALLVTLGSFAYFYFTYLADLDSEFTFKEYANVMFRGSLLFGAYSTIAAYPLFKGRIPSIACGYAVAAVLILPAVFSNIPALFSPVLGLIIFVGAMISMAIIYAKKYSLSDLGIWFILVVEMIVVGLVLFIASPEIS